jgi:hypothetical protein
MSKFGKGLISIVGCEIKNKRLYGIQSNLLMETMKIEQRPRPPLMLDQVSSRSV